jgi:hypothetical protein
MVAMESWWKEATSDPSRVKTEPPPYTRPAPALVASVTMSSHCDTSIASTKWAVCPITPVDRVRWASSMWMADR